MNLALGETPTLTFGCPGNTFEEGRYFGQGQISAFANGGAELAQVRCKPQGISVNWPITVNCNKPPKPPPRGMYLVAPARLGGRKPGLRRNPCAEPSIEQSVNRSRSGATVVICVTVVIG